ncbi:hypothetical protein [Paenisporosarcina sp. TG20]|uniref:hypothetical protein n=1 Tax=Paenisporosarcina sp. TG20 TaxID=1211706 RepID=UPI0002F3D441|nr:hypothetical protein [Paenisporosarcina sp. TG20]
MNRASIIIVGIIFSIGLLLIGFISLEIIKGKEENFDFPLPVKELNKIENSVKTPSGIEKDVDIEIFTNAKKEASRWNQTVRNQFGTKGRYEIDLDNIAKDETKSDGYVTTFYYVIENSLDIRIVYIVDNVTKNVIEMRLVGYEEAGVNRGAIFQAMSVFISYVDNYLESNMPLPQTGGQLIETSFGTDLEGVNKVEVEFSGKKYYFVLDVSNGMNMLVYPIIQ